jgi:UDP-N-acetylmuramoylalanine--D-glutamate ligase
LRGAKRRSNLNKRDTKVEIVDSLAQAVQLAARLAVNGDIILLSPACASYDMFDNFQQRGQEFMRHVRALNTYRTNSQTQSA